MTQDVAGSIGCLDVQPQDLIARRMIQGVALVDLAITFPLALPITAPVFVNVIYYCNSFLSGLSGQTSQLALSPLAYFFANLAGVLGVLWAIVRLFRPYRFLVYADVLCRCFIVILLLYYILKGFVPLVFVAFVATETVGAVLEFMVFGK